VTRIAAVVLLGAAVLANGHPGAAEVRIPSSLGGEPQPARWLAPQPGNEPTPLLIWLHSWSADHTQTDPGERVLEGAGDRGWACILPNFRGPNSRPRPGATSSTPRHGRSTGTGSTPTASTSPEAPAAGTWPS